MAAQCQRFFEAGPASGPCSSDRRRKMKAPAILAVLATFTVSAVAQKMQTAAGEAPGPWILGTIGVGKGPDPKTPLTTALKGIAIKVGQNGEAAVAYDLDLCRMAGAWTGGKFTTPMNLMSRGEYPTAMGNVVFTSGDVAGLVAEAKAAKDAVINPAPWKDGRDEPFGPLPEGQARFKGFHTQGDKVALTWSIGGKDVLELPGFETHDGLGFITRTFALPATEQPLTLVLVSIPEPNLAATGAALPLLRLDTHGERGSYEAVEFKGLYVEAWGIPQGAALKARDGQLVLVLPAQAKASQIKIAYAATTEADQGRIEAVSNKVELPKAPLSGLLTGGPAHWPEPVTTQGELSKDEEGGYVVDTIKLPDPNPWTAPMFLGGLDFFADGRAAVSTFHGDVFLVSGLDKNLEKVSWRRFATGLYHALGLKIVKDEVYVTCRDGVWRLKDLNKDGEADFYEAFNFDVKVTKNFHEFVFDLQTDPQGNFYFAKAGPVRNGGRGFDQIMAHHGALLKVSPDGKKLETVATGFRAPNGIGVGPKGELTSGDNEGTWTPTCKINWIKPGGFYGVVDLAHRPTPPTDYDRPLCWLPKRVDNSGGGQVWAPEGWGPWGGKMLHLSYGQSALYGVLAEDMSASGQPGVTMQGGVTKFPLGFQSGIMRGRFSPTDHQLYVIGLRGWQTNGLKNGAFQRVRYTGASPRMPIEMHAKKGGIELRFTSSLDTQAAADPENWHVEQWRYVWSAAYGSPELSAETPSETPTEPGKDGAAQFSKAQMGKAKHDPVVVKSVSIGTDDRSVFLEIPDLKPVMQMSIKYDLKTSDGADLRGEVVNTIHALGEK